MKILITGAAGFIGFHCSLRLMERGHQIVGIDNLNDYYDVNLKQARLSILQQNTAFEFHRLDLADRQGIASLFKVSTFDAVLHLGAQAGVRYSIDNPFAYIDSNITGMLTILEGCRHSGIKHLVYASSSSVYGTTAPQPFSTLDRADSPISLYAATKRSDELMAHCYSHLYGIHAIGLRFFTVYGPYGRPDMAYFKFANAITTGIAIDVYNHGNMMRDFTYIDDIVNGVTTIIESKPAPSSEKVPHKVYNLGNNKPESLGDMIRYLEVALNKKAVQRFLPMQPGDVYETYADITDAARDFNYKPVTSLKDGITKFANWHNKHTNSLIKHEI